MGPKRPDFCLLLLLFATGYGLGDCPNPATESPHCIVPDPAQGFIARGPNVPWTIDNHNHCWNDKMDWAALYLNGTVNASVNWDPDEHHACPSYGCLWTLDTTCCPNGNATLLGRCVDTDGDYDTDSTTITIGNIYLLNITRGTPNDPGSLTAKWWSGGGWNALGAFGGDTCGKCNGTSLQSYDCTTCGNNGLPPRHEEKGGATHYLYQRHTGDDLDEELPLCTCWTYCNNMNTPPYSGDINDPDEYPWECGDPWEDPSQQGAMGPYGVKLPDNLVTCGYSGENAMKCQRTGINIHGQWNQEELECTWGCVRMWNADIHKIHDFVEEKQDLGCKVLVYCP